MIREQVRLDASPDRSFAVFAEGMTAWWPREYSWSGEGLDHIGIEPRAGGHCIERGPGGFHCDWGTVTASDPPRRLAFLWQIGPDRVPQPDPQMASEVSVAFEPDGAGTLLTLEHDGFERHGEGAEGYEAAMASPQGWPYVLGRLSESLARG